MVAALMFIFIFLVFYVIYTAVYTQVKEEREADDLAADGDESNNL